MAGNVAAPATDPCPGGAHMPPCRHPNSRTANRGRYPPSLPSPRLCFHHKRRRLGTLRSICSVPLLASQRAVRHL